MTGEGEVRPVVGAFRLVLVPFVGLALVATLSLTLRPGATADYFAWTIAPPFTAALLGAAYAGALTLFVLSLRERAWANVRIAVSAPFALSTALLAATLLHLDKFHLDEGGVAGVVAWVWLLVYLAVPPALLVVVALQRRVPGGDPPRTSPLPPALRATVAAVGVASIVGGAVLFAVPEDVADHWPWAITPLTGRVVAAWLLGLGVAAVHVALEDDLRRVRAATAALAVIGGLGLLATAVHADDLDGGLGTVVLVVWLGLLFALGLTGVVLERRRST